MLKEFRYNLRHFSGLLLFALSALLTYSEGMEYASRGGVTNAALERGIAAVAQEWAHRTSIAGVGFPLLAATGLVWLHCSRDRRHGFSSLVFVRPIRTGQLVMQRVVPIIGVALTTYLAGLFAGIMLVGLVAGLWPDAGILVLTILLNLVPGFVAWILVVCMVTTVLPDVKSWIFPLVILWLVLINIPVTSMFWFYRSIDYPLNPTRDPGVWLKIMYCFFVAGISYAVLVWAVGRERVDGMWTWARPKKAGDFYVALNALGGRLRLALKITIGTKLYIALGGVTILAVVMISPFGILMHQPLYVKEYFVPAFSELLFPLVGLLVTSGFLPISGGMEEIIMQRPGGEGKLLEQKLVGLGTYLLLTCLTYSLWTKVFLPTTSLVKAFGTLFPSVLFLSGLAILTGVTFRSTFWSYVVCLAYWGAAYVLQERFPWFLSPIYHLAEYSFKMRQDLLWTNKITLLTIDIIAIYLSFFVILRKPVNVHER